MCRPCVELWEDEEEEEEEAGGLWQTELEEAEEERRALGRWRLGQTRARLGSAPPLPVLPYLSSAAAASGPHVHVHRLTAANSPPRSSATYLTPVCWTACAHSTAALMTAPSHRR